MQTDQSLIQTFDFNVDSEAGRLLATINDTRRNTINSKGPKRLDLVKINRLLNIKPLKGSDGEDKLVTEKEEAYITNYENSILKERE